jgi:hypothetical protein
MHRKYGTIFLCPSPVFLQWQSPVSFKPIKNQRTAGSGQKRHKTACSVQRAGFNAKIQRKALSYQIWFPEAGLVASLRVELNSLNFAIPHHAAPV